MIVFGSSITAPDKYLHYAEPGVRVAAEPDSEVWAFSAAGSIMRSYNLLLDRAAQRDDIEALVLLHQDTEIVDPDFCRKAREALADPDVALVGAAGAIGVRSIAYWEGSVTWGSFVHRYPEHGGGEVAALSWRQDEAPPYSRTGEVETVDGFLMVMSPWAIRNVRFDESLGALHGYDFDYCLQVREQGKKVATADFRAVHHHSLDLIGDQSSWIEAHMRVAEKWDGRMPGVGVGGGDWKLRARRAEAEAAAARVQGASAELLGNAHVAALQRDLEEATSSISWKLTAPLRWINHRRRAGGPRTRIPGPRRGSRVG